MSTTPVVIHLVWHPRSDAICRPLAEQLYAKLNREAYQPLLPGIGVPVFYRCIGDPGSIGGVPAPIRVDGKSADLRVFLVTADFLNAPAWEDYLDASIEELAAAPERGCVLPVMLAAGLADGDRKATVIEQPAAESALQTLLQLVLLQACRLLGGRSGDRGPRPARLFLSHTKRDGTGLKVAQRLKQHLDGMTLDQFFDEVSIQPGDSIADELESNIAGSAVVAIRTDGYVSSPWCRYEIAAAKRARRPMVVIDALSGIEPRSSPLLANLPSLRIDPDHMTASDIERAVTFIGLELLRFLYANALLERLKAADRIDPNAILLVRPPEAADLLQAHEAGTIFVHPDPILSLQELAGLEGHGVEVATPTSRWRGALAGRRIGISVAPGDPGDEARHGVSALHVEDAARVIARQLLIAGGTLVYGGALAMPDAASRNLTESLREIIATYRKDEVALEPLENHVAWPWNLEVDALWRATRRRTLRLVEYPRPDGVAFSGDADRPGAVGRMAQSGGGRHALALSLSEMRRGLTAASDARIAIGGKPSGFLGFLPGIVEEVLLTIEAGKPCYVIGGFGGAAALVADALEGMQPEALTVECLVAADPGYAALQAELAATGGTAPDPAAVVARLNDYGIEGLSRANGLSAADNRALLRTADLDLALDLIMPRLVPAG